MSNFICVRSANADLLDVARGRTAGHVPVVPYRILPTCVSVSRIAPCPSDQSQPTCTHIETWCLCLSALRLPTPDPTTWLRPCSAGPHMGPASAELSADVSINHRLEALCAFPSPASVTDSLNSPAIEFNLRDAQAPCQPLSARHGLLDTANILPAQPGDVQIESIVTPLADEAMPEPDMNLIVGGALAPVHVTPPPRAPPRRSRPALRLPSFQSLGIALPNLDRFGLDSSLTSTTTEGIQRPLDAPYGGPELLAGSDTKLPGGRAVQSPIRQLVNTLTPPAEPAHLDWSSMRTVISAMDSPSTDPSNVTPSEAPRQSGSTASATGQPSQISTGQSDKDDRPQWIRGAVSALSQSSKREKTNATNVE